MGASGKRRLLVALVATALVLTPLAWMWQRSLLPDSYSVMDMGYLDYGGGSEPSGGDGPNLGGSDHGGGHGDAHGGRSVASLKETRTGPADVRLTLVARAGQIELASGRLVDGYTLNGTSPGPLIEAVQGQLVEVTLVNESVADGVTLHWHGVNVPNAEDGVAGVTQDAVARGGRHTYRWVAEQAGTYWYHSHQVSHEQVQRGLLGPLVVRPAVQTGTDAEPADVRFDAEHLALMHVYAGRRTVNGTEGDLRVPADAGDRVRVRVINTDNGPAAVWVSGAAYRVLAVDGNDVNRPTTVTDAALRLTAGARADLEVVLPDDGSGARVELGGSSALVLGGERSPTTKSPQPRRWLDLLSYGSPDAPDFEADEPDRTFEYSIGRRPGFVDGRPGFWWSINGHLFPDIPMFVVEEGDVVRMRISNSSGDVHPMHLHGHHVLVLSRNGVAATGSPWWTDSLNVEDEETYEVAFVADNPGVWMDHCHNLPHAKEGLVAHLMYTDVTTPYVVHGAAHNRPE